MTLFGIVIRRRHLAYFLTDGIAYLLAMEAAHGIARIWGGHPEHLPAVLRLYTGASLFLVCSNVLALYLADAYQRSNDFRRPMQHLKIWMAVAGAQALSLMAYGLFPHGWWGPGVAITTGLTLASLLSASRYLLCRIRPVPAFMTRTLVVGTGRSAQLIEELLQREREQAPVHDLVGFYRPPNGHPRRRAADHLDDDLPEGARPPSPLLCTGGSLPDIVRAHRVDLIIVAVRGNLPGDLARDLLECKTLGANVEEMPTFYKRLTGQVPVLHLSDCWFVYGPVFYTKNRLATGARRIADVGFALGLGLLVLPVVALAAALISIESPGSPFFFQERLGRNERPFRIVKLRTMRRDAEAASGPTWASTDDPRATFIGRYLRRTRIDELPQLYNVLHGEMSLVGPRPERAHFVHQLKEQIPFYALRFAVKPGLTGWAQVHFRYGNTVEDAIEKLRYELYEIQEITPAMYLFILLKTVQTVLLRPGS
ncbi:MAG: exopolysaccharide biosynthesis polyprenyl glycosylphosphotransferase [Pseudomonadota bacterium]